MEPTEAPLRFILPLGKFPVIERRNNFMIIRLSGPHGEPYSLLCALPDRADVRVGDILTLYTEVLYDKTTSNLNS
jgi:hypothetical protein